MKKKLEIRNKNGTSDLINSNYYESKARLIILADLINNHQEPLLLSIKHKELITHLECSKLNNYNLISLDQDGLVTGISFLSSVEKGTYGIITQAKQIMFIPFNSELNLRELFKVSW